MAKRAECTSTLIPTERTPDSTKATGQKTDRRDSMVLDFGTDVGWWGGERIYFCSDSDGNVTSVGPEALKQTTLGRLSALPSRVSKPPTWS